jgi:hypothetical protein
MEAIADLPTYNRARAVRYDDTARTMVQAFKYGDRLDLAPAMGRWMAQAGHEGADGGGCPDSGAVALAQALDATINQAAILGQDHRC